jgi:hypothetical protein
VVAIIEVVQQGLSASRNGTAGVYSSATGDGNLFRRYRDAPPIFLLCGIKPSWQRRQRIPLLAPKCFATAEIDIAAAWHVGTFNPANSRRTIFNSTSISGEDC